jgi:hypothetical protein
VIGGGTRVEELESKWSTDQLMAGINFSSWMKLLARNEFDVHPEYLHRAAWLTGLSVPSSALSRMEDAIYARTLADMDVDPEPLFILGHWRSGTTHMHNLLGRDPNHTFSTLWQVVFPGSMLLTGKAGPRLLKGALPDKRSYDNVRQGWNEAAEDEIALAKMTGLSLYVGFMFPDRAAEYEKYIDFLECTHAEKQRWKHAFQYFIKKIMLATGGKRVIVKSCPHSARIRMILEMYPNAKFVHIHRNPYETFASMMHMRGKVDWENFVQRPHQSFLDQRREQTAVIGERVFERLIEDRKFIPPENFYEVAYDDFCGNELERLEAIYTRFGLPDWERYKAAITPYLSSLQGYKKNPLTIDRELQDFVYDRWRLVFDTYGYRKEYP